jgi:hypothetical protein
MICRSRFKAAAPGNGRGREKDGNPAKESRNLSQYEGWAAAAFYIALQGGLDGFKNPVPRYRQLAPISARSAILDCPHYTSIK